MNLVDESTLVGETDITLKLRIENSRKALVERKDLISIKNDLLSKVDNPDYWKTLRMFLHGKCSKGKFDEVMDKTLPTLELKQLHNKLIQAIIYNVHFATAPPPGISIPLNSSNESRFIQNQNFHSIKTIDFIEFSASKCGHLLSCEKILHNIQNLLKKFHYNQTVDNNSLIIIQKACQKFITRIIRYCVETFSSGNHLQSHIITISQITSFFRRQKDYLSVICPHIISQLEE